MGESRAHVSEYYIHRLTLMTSEGTILASTAVGTADGSLEDLMSAFETGWSRFAGFGSGIEMYETEEHVILRVDVPGLDPKQLNVIIRNGTLCLGYEDQREWRDGNGEGSSRRYAAFRRSVTLPEGLDVSTAEAACKNGVLAIRIPWTPEARDRSRTIVVPVD